MTTDHPDSCDPAGDLLDGFELADLYLRLADRSHRRRVVPALERRRLDRLARMATLARVLIARYGPTRPLIRRGRVLIPVGPDALVVFEGTIDLDDHAIRARCREALPSPRFIPGPAVRLAPATAQPGPDQPPDRAGPASRPDLAIVHPEDPPDQTD